MQEIQKLQVSQSHIDCSNLRVLLEYQGHEFIFRSVEDEDEVAPNDMDY